MIKSGLEPYGCFHTCMFLNAKLNLLFIYASIYFTVSSQHLVLPRLCLCSSPFETLSVCILPITQPEMQHRMRHNCFSKVFFFSVLNLLSLVQHQKQKIEMAKVILMCFCDNRFSSHSALPSLTRHASVSRMKMNGDGFAPKEQNKKKKNCGHEASVAGIILG